LAAAAAVAGGPAAAACHGAPAASAKGVMIWANPIVIARSDSDEAIQLSTKTLDCFAKLAMTEIGPRRG
jgi:hypothetical protein